MPLFLKLCLFDFKSASRNYRELSAAVEAGYDVKVLAGVISSPFESGTIDEEHGFVVHRFSPYPILKLPFESRPRRQRSIFEKGIRFALRLPYFIHYFKCVRSFKWVKAVRTFNADVISCHDLPALVIGYVSTWFMKKNKKPKLIYDSHEFELGRNTTRSRFKAWGIKFLERFMIKRSALSVMVNDSIADEVQRVHNLKTRPLVVRSTPPNWAIDTSVCERRRAKFVKLLDVDFDPFFVMYHGGFLKNRGIEMLIKTVAKNPYIVGIILGYALDEDYLISLKNLAKEQDVEKRILFLPAVPIENLWEYVGAADVGTSFIQNTCINHLFSLPNKFFENIQSLTPIITSDFPEMRRLIHHYDIGLTCDTTSIEDINSCIEKLRTDKQFYIQLKENLKVAKEDLCWENEKVKLIEYLIRLA